MYKKHDACAKLLFCQCKPIAFLLLLLLSPSSMPKLTIVLGHRYGRGDVM